MIEFFLPMIPPTITQQEHQVRVVNGKPIFYDPPELKAAKDKFAAALWLHRPGAALAGPVRLLTKWIWPLDEEEPFMPMELEPTYFVWKTSKPDTDNLIKMFKDCMTKVGFWEDDAQVVSEITEKMLSFHPGIYVKVEPL